MNRSPFVLWLIWQNPITKERYHVGNLSYYDGKYIFSYEQSDKQQTLQEARKNGYSLLEAFSDPRQVYVSDRLFKPFATRLPERSSVEFKYIVQELGLPLDCTEMDLLYVTGGRQVTDTYEFIEPIHVYGEYFTFNFYLAEWSMGINEALVAQLQIGDKVHFALHSMDHEQQVISVLTASLEKPLGIVPSFYSGFMAVVLQSQAIYEAEIAQVNPLARWSSKVNISVLGKLTEVQQKAQLMISSNRELEPLQFMSR